MSIPDGEGGVLTVSCDVAKESKPPVGCKAVEWRLLTNRTATGFAGAVELIKWYRCRSAIEIFFNVLKNGCHIAAL